MALARRMPELGEVIIFGGGAHGIIVELAGRRNHRPHRKSSRGAGINAVTPA